MRPLGELDVRDELRLGPGDTRRAETRISRHACERAPLARERPERGEHLVECSFGESGADVSGVDELSALVQPREDERAEPLACALASHPARDSQLLAPPRLDLEPVAAPRSGPIPRVRPLGHDPFEPLGYGHVHQGRAIVEHVREPYDRAVRDDRVGEACTALVERQVEERPAVELEQVEDKVREPAASLLQEREARPALAVEGDHLAVHHAVVVAKRLRERLRYGVEPLGQVLAAAAREGRAAAIDASDDAVAVPLHLEEPPVAGRNRVGRGGQHRQVRPRPGGHVLRSRRARRAASGRSARGLRGRPPPPRPRASRRPRRRRARPQRGHGRAWRCRTRRRAARL